MSNEEGRVVVLCTGERANTALENKKKSGERSDNYRFISTINNISSITDIDDHTDTVDSANDYNSN